jgi:UDP-glucose 4-epimerase
MKNFIVVTGGAGFIGSNLIKFLISQTNSKIISIDNYTSGSKKNHIFSNRIKYIKGDTRNIEKKLIPYKGKIKCLFHFGEFSRIHESFFQLSNCLSSNIHGTAKVIEYCLKNKTKLIYSATSASFGNKGEDENLSPYAFTKSRNLKMLINLRKWFKFSFEVLYFYNVYGPGHIKYGKMATVIGIFERQYSNNKPLTVSGNGKQTRKFTYIKDVVNACYYAWKKSKNRHYQVSNNKLYKILNVAKFFSKKIKFIKSKLGDRYSAENPKRIMGIKIYKILCNTDLKEYIYLYKNNLKLK